MLWVPSSLCDAGVLGSVYDKIVSQPLPLQYVFLICLMCTSCSASFWMSFRGNCSVCNCRLGVIYGRGEFRNFLCSHLELVLPDFCMWCQGTVQLNSSACVYPVFSQFIEDIIISLLCVLGIFVEKSVDLICMYLFLDSIFCFIGLSMCVYADVILFWLLYTVLIYFKIRQCVASSFVPLSQDCLGY